MYYTVTWRLRKLRGTFQIKGETFYDVVERLKSVEVVTDLHPDAQVVGVRESVVRAPNKKGDK